MRRFYFNVDGQQDIKGAFLASLVEAKCEAMTLLTEAVCKQPDLFWSSAEWELTVTDDAGMTMFQLQIIGTEAPAIRKMSTPSILPKAA